MIEFGCVQDYEEAAERKLSAECFAYYVGGSAHNDVHRENCEAFKRWRFRPRLLRDVSCVQTETEVLGSKINFPICISPTSLLRWAHKEAEVPVARASQDLGTGFVLSMSSNCSMPEVGKAAPSGVLWCHVQILTVRQAIVDVVRIAENNGFRGFVVTIDQPVLSNRLYRTRAGTFRVPALDASRGTMDPIMAKYLPERVRNERFSEVIDASAVWDDIDWLKGTTKLPVMVKGILTAEMASEAVRHNVDGILVSNHGGRQLDSTFPTIDVLPEIVKAVNGRCDVFLDGGIRTGSDVAKAIALGAKAVFVGRPVIWGLTCNGESGVKRVLEILRDEFIITMKLLGVTSLDELRSTPHLVVHQTWRHSNL